MRNTVLSISSRAQLPIYDPAANGTAYRYHMSSNFLMTIDGLTALIELD